MHELGEYGLRKPEVRDADALYVQKNDREIAAMLGGFNNGYTRDDILKWIDLHRAAKDEALWVIADKEDRCLGHVGLYKIDQRIGSAEFAILIGERSVWGSGLGRSCTRFAVEYGFHQLNLRRIYLEVLVTNTRAAGLYRSIGFVEEGRLRQAQFKNGQYVDVLIMGLLRDEYRREHG